MYFLKIDKVDLFKIENFWTSKNITLKWRQAVDREKISAKHVSGKSRI